MREKLLKSNYYKSLKLAVIISILFILIILIVPVVGLLSGDITDTIKFLEEVSYILLIPILLSLLMIIIILFKMNGLKKRIPNFVYKEATIVEINTRIFKFNYNYLIIKVEGIDKKIKVRYIYKQTIIKDNKIAILLDPSDNYAIIVDGDKSNEIMD